MTLEEMQKHIKAVEIKEIGEGLYVAIYPLLYHWTMVLGDLSDTCSFMDRWCYADEAKARMGFNWDGKGEPTGWHRHPATARRRPDGDPALEYRAS